MSGPVTAPVAPLSPDALEPLILRQQVAAVYSTIRAATLADGVVAMVFGALMYWQLGNPLILVWMGLHALTVLRLPVLTAYFRAPPLPGRSGHWARLYGRELMTNSAVWGLAPLLFLPEDDLPLISLTMLVIMGICATGALAVAPLRQALARYVVPMMLGLAVALAWHGGMIALFLSGSCIAWLLVTLKFAYAQHHLLTESLRMRYEKEALAEQLREQVVATELASQEKTRFLATASHDLRQPLHAIALFGSALVNVLRDRPEQQNALRLMGAVNTLGQSLDTMLDISRLDADVVTPEWQSLSVNALFQSLNQDFVGRASEKDLQLRFRSSPLWVRSDPQLLRRLLSNLIDNAIKYTLRGGVLVLARRRGEQVLIDVLDTGIGIAAEQLPQVFEEFYQVGNPGRDRTQGLGIGLSIVRRLSHLLGHAVEVRSEPGQGSRFRVRLSMARPERPPASGALQRANSPHPLPGRMLVLDDEAEIRTGMLELLSSHGVEVGMAVDEAEAQAALAAGLEAQRPFDLLICDFRLARGVDGLAAGQNLCRQFPGLSLLLVTGETSPERLQSVRSAAIPVLFKPVTAERLLAAMAQTAR